MQGLGEEDHTSSTRPVAVQYYRQVLQKKCSGGVARELLSLCATADFLVKGRVTQALDLVFQRIKSAESTLNGTLWTVSQKLELLPAEQATLTGVPEMKEAQKIAFEESKTRWMASLPEGRPSNGPKGSGKGKQSGKEGFQEGKRRKERRESARPERRLEEKRRRRRSEGKLAEEGMTEDVRSGNKSPEAEEPSGVESPEKASLEGTRTEDVPYEGRTALASQALVKQQPSSQSDVAYENEYNALAQSVHVAAPPFEKNLRANGF